MEHLISVRPFFLLPCFLPSTSSAFRASSDGLEVEGRERMFDPGAWGRSIGLPAHAYRVWCMRARSGNVGIGNGAFVDRPRPGWPRPRMRQQQRCVEQRWAKATDETEGRLVGRSDALGERRVGDRERDLVAQGKGERARKSAAPPRAEIEERSRTGNADLTNVADVGQEFLQYF